jgi:DNA-directed RNA polymerase specialized sigma24 family protein
MVGWTLESRRDPGYCAASRYLSTLKQDWTMQAFTSPAPTMHAVVLRAWSAGDNTADIARLLDVSEPEVERILVEAREARRITPPQDGDGAAPLRT